MEAKVSMVDIEGLLAVVYVDPKYSCSKWRSTSKAKAVQIATTNL